MSEVRVYDAPSDLVGRWVREADMQALRAENQRLREALKTAQELLCVPERNQDAGWEDRRRQVDEALQPKEPSHD